MSLFFAYIVLVGHIHYSIDVAAAPFITYGVYQFARYFFDGDYDYFKKECAENKPVQAIKILD